jgi:hypothetical protein
MRYFIKPIFVLLPLFWYLNSAAQNDAPQIIVVDNLSQTQLNIKSATKLNDKPVIADTIKKIENLNYHITSKSVNTIYDPQYIVPAKMVNEPLSKLYHCLIKAGMGNYTMPYAEVFINNTRSKETAYGFRFKHLSSTASLKNLGFSGFSDNEVYLNGKKFFRKHTLSGDFNYQRNANHFYGLDSVNWGVDRKSIRQIFHIFEAKARLVSHYTDTTHVNHDVGLNFYNFSDRYGINESNVNLNGLIKAYIMGEKLNVSGSLDFFNHKMSSDTVNNTIFKLNPYFVAEGEKFKADIGVMAVIDQFQDSSAKFYFYPRLNISYNVYENILIPYAGISGDLQKNSFRSLTSINPFLESQIDFKNSNTKFEVFGGLKGAISSKTTYDARVGFKRVDNFAMFLINYDNALKNRFNMVYDGADILTLSGQVQYSLKEKINIVAAGNYYRYNMSNFTYAWHKPAFDIKLSGFYNIKSKIIAKMDLYFIGNQWTKRSAVDGTGITIHTMENMKGMADINLGAEYRYSKFLSAFVNFNNIGHMRYYRWDRYPTQRLNCMVGLTFVPF